jgi:hypothetical protein
MNHRIGSRSGQRLPRLRAGTGIAAAGCGARLVPGMIGPSDAISAALAAETPFAGRRGHIAACDSE